MKNHKTKGKQIYIMLLQHIRFLLPSLTHLQGSRCQSQVYKICFQPALSKTHVTTTYLLTNQALQTIKLGFLSLPLSPPAPHLPTPNPLYKNRLSICASPSPIGSQENVPMVTHSAPMGVT